MARREDVDNAIWGDPDFADLSPTAKLLYLWSFTNPLCGMSGLYRVARKYARVQVGMTDEQTDEAFAELAAARFVFHQGDVCWVRSRVKHLRTKTPQIARSIANDLAKIAADHPLRAAFVAEYEDTPWLGDALATIVEAAPAHVSLKRRREVFERDGHACVDCGSTEHLTIDHVIPRSAGGTAAIENLAARCASCNSVKGVSLPDSQRRSMEPPRPSPNLGEGHRPSPRFHGKGKGKGRDTEEPQTTEENHQTRAPARATDGGNDAVPHHVGAGLHPALPEVLDVLAAAPGIVVEAMAVDSACRAHPDLDAPAAAHTVASWAHEGGLTVTSASRLLHRAFERQATDAAKRAEQVNGIRSAHDARRGAPAASTVPQVDYDAVIER